MQSTLRAAFLPRADYWRFLGDLLGAAPKAKVVTKLSFLGGVQGSLGGPMGGMQRAWEGTQGYSPSDEGHQTSWPLALQAQGWNFPKGAFCSEAEKKTEAGVQAGITFLTHTKLACMCRLVCGYGYPCQPLTSASHSPTLAPSPTPGLHLVLLFL